MERRRGINKKFLGALGLAAVILLYNFTPIGHSLTWLREPLVRVGGVWFAAGRGWGDWWRGLTRGGYLQEELRHKESVIADLVRANTDLNYLADTNRDLRALVGLKNSQPEKKIMPAEVVWINSATGRGLLTINRGQADGIVAKLPVLSADGVFIGKVLTVAAQSATVLLTTDRESAVAATSGRDPNLQAIVKGKVGLSLALELIPQDALIEIGDIIITSALEENTPWGLALGRVAGVFYKEGELFKRANLEPLVAASNLRVVAVLLGAN